MGSVDLITDYGAAVLAIMVLVAGINWFIHAKHNFHGPRLDNFDL